MEWRFLRYTIPPNGSTVVLSIFHFFIMGKMVICSMYNIIEKKNPRCQGYVKKT
jgi:hypothetical protein